MKLLTLASTVAGAAALGSIVTPTGYGPVTTAANGGTLTTLLAADSSYDTDVEIMTLRGSRYNMGLDFAELSCSALQDNYDALLTSIVGDNKLVIKLVGMLADWQWDDYLSKQVPDTFMQELSGVADGCAAAGIADGGAMASRSIVVANLPGDLDDIVYVLADELLHSEAPRWAARRAAVQRELGLADATSIEAALRSLENYGHHCSMAGAWGDRTQNGDVLSMRNLDWMVDTGVNKHKQIAVFIPDDGAAPHATVGFAGLYGALAGMSATGFTVHEANLEADLDSFRGFPWTLRLRYVMENAKDLEHAVELMQGTNSTCGFNHAVYSGADQAGYVFETYAGYTIPFADNDEREATALWNGTTYGAPLPNAVWRTNHGYDPTTIEHYMWNTTHAFVDSKERYNLIHDAIVNYEAQGVLMGPAEMVNITAGAGGKGGDRWTCDPADYDDAENVLSVAFDPANGFLYSAWESSTGADWVPAACSSYMAVNMTDLWA